MKSLLLNVRNHKLHSEFQQKLKIFAEIGAALNLSGCGKYSARWWFSVFCNRKPVAELLRAY
jgi:hypothetical protein